MVEIGDGMIDIGKKITTSVTVPLVGMGVAAWAAFNEVDAGEDAIIKKTGATGESLAEMSDIMKAIATEIPTDFETAGNAVGEVNTKFGVTGGTLKNLSKKFIEFATINDTDVVGAIDGVQQALTAFGMDADDAGTYLGKLTDVSQRYGISTDELTSLVVSNAAAFNEMGLNLYDANEFLGKVSVSGADTNAVMSGLSKALKNATDDGIPLNQALEDLQKTILEGKDGTDGLTASYNLFGKSGAAVYEAVRNGTLDFTNLNGAAKETGNIVSDTFNAMLDPSDEFKVAMNKIKVLGYEIAKKVMPALSKILEKVSGFIDKATEKWNSLTDSQQQTILKILGIIAAIGPLIVAGGGLIKGIGTIITLMTGPAGIVVAIGAVIAAGVWLVKNWDTVKAKAKQIWEDIKKFFTDGLNKIKEMDWAGLGSKMWDAVKKPFIDVASWFKGKFDNVKAVLSSVNFGEIGAAMWNAIKSKFGSVKEWFYDKFKAAVNAVIGLLNTMIAKAESAINKVVRGINNKLTVNVDFGNLPKILGGGSLGGIHWSPNIKEASFKRISYLASGGVVSNGGRAIVGEYAPEMLRVVNGRAVVTPLSSTPGRFASGNVTINVYAQPGQSAKQIAAEVQRVFVMQQKQRGAAYA